MYLPLFISQILDFIHIERVFFDGVTVKCYSPTWFCSMRCGKKKEEKNTCILPYLGIFVEDSDTCFKYFVPLSYFANLHKECLLFFMRNSIWKHWRCITIQQRNVIIQSSKSRLLVNLTKRKVVLIIMLVETKLILALGAPDNRTAKRHLCFIKADAIVLVHKYRKNTNSFYLP